MSNPDKKATPLPAGACPKLGSTRENAVLETRTDHAEMREGKVRMR